MVCTVETMEEKPSHMFKLPDTPIIVSPATTVPQNQIDYYKMKMRNYSKKEERYERDYNKVSSVVMEQIREDMLYELSCRDEFEKIKKNTIF